MCKIYILRNTKIDSNICYLIFANSTSTAALIRDLSRDFDFRFPVKQTDRFSRSRKICVDT